MLASLSLQHIASGPYFTKPSRITYKSIKWVAEKSVFDKQTCISNKIVSRSFLNEWAQQSVANENVLLPKYFSNLPYLAIRNNFLTLLESATCKFPTGAISPKTFYQLWQVEQILSIVKGAAIVQFWTAQSSL